MRIYCSFLNITLLLTYLLLLMGASTSFAQDKNGDKDCTQKDIRDLFRKKDKTPKPPKKVMILVLPNVSSNPANGFLMGLGGTVGWFWGPKETTRVSAVGFSAAYTTKNQFLSFAKSNVYTTDDKFYLQGDWRYYIYKAPTWGLGTDAPDTVDIPSSWSWQGADIEETDGAYPMDYNYFKFHQTVNRKITTFLYAGLGYHLDLYTQIDDNFLHTDTLPAQLTPHFIYSKLYDFSPERYVLSGLSINFLYDSRDNLMNPYKGYFANINFRYNPTFLGSDHNSSSLWMEFRTYVSLSKKTPRHLVAFWAFGNFQITGEQPYLTLMALGEDQKARSGRAYVAGRYRGEDLVYGEVEYRFPITQCSKILGGVIFLNLTTASNRTTETPLFAYVRPGVGFGFRFMINKHFRTNLNLDFGFGHKSKGFYFSGTETF